MTATPDTPAPDRPCTTCGAGLADGQDWCLECGSAQPGRLGARPGWRAALAVLALTVLLAGGAVAAAYAALSSEARREAAAPAPAPAAPQVAQPPVQTAPAPQTQPVTPAVKVPKAKAPAAPPAQSDDAAVDDTAGTPAPSTDTGADTGADPGAATDEPAGSDPLELAADAAKTYDPYSRAGGQAGDPADAVDGKPSTAWQAPVGADGKVRIGLAISLEKARTLSKLAFTADTPGFTVEVYGTTSSELPPDVLDTRWEHVTDRREVGPDEDVGLGGKYRHVLLWVTSQPADTIVRIPEVQVFG